MTNSSKTLKCNLGDKMSLKNAHALSIASNPSLFNSVPNGFRLTFSYIKTKLTHENITNMIWVLCG